MNTVEPIRDPALVKKIAEFYKVRNERDYILFLFGIYSGRRISDILPMRVFDVKGRTQIKVRETKTGKTILLPINPMLKKALDKYIADKCWDAYLFPGYLNQPIGRKRAWQILQQAKEEFNLELFGCHSLRKTFGYHFYQNSKRKDNDIVILMEIFNHSSIAQTRRYIGIVQDNINEAVKNFKIF